MHFYYDYYYCYHEFPTQPQQLLLIINKTNAKIKTKTNITTDKNKIQKKESKKGLKTKNNEIQINHIKHIKHRQQQQEPIKERE